MMRTLVRTTACAAILATALGACHRREAPATNTTTAETAPASTATTAAPDTSAPPSTAPADQGATQGVASTGAGGLNGGTGVGPGAGEAGRRMGAGGMGAGGMAGLSLPQFQERFRQRMLARVDTDHDGRISLQEWVAWRNAHPRPGGGGVDPTRQFQHLDLNHDGYLSGPELDAIAARRYQRRMAMGGAGMAGGRMGAMRQGGAGADANDDEGGPQ